MRCLKNMEKNWEHRNQNKLLPYENELTCVSCGNNAMKRKHELSKIRCKK